MTETPVRFRFLASEEVMAAGGDDIPATIASCEEALRMWSMGEAKEASAPAMRWTKAGTSFAVIHGGYVGAPYDVAGVKWVNTNPRNREERNIPRSLSQIILTDRESTLPLAIMDGTIIGSARCGAVAAIGSKYLMRPGATTCAAIGCGAAQQMHLRALREVAHLRELRLFDVRTEQAESLAGYARAHLAFDDVVVMSSAEQAVRGADIIACATVISPENSYLEPDWLSDGAVVANISAVDLKDSAVSQADRIVVTSREHLSRRGSCARAYARGLVSKDKVCEIGEIIAGRVSGRMNAAERIIYDSGGMGINDVINAHRVYKNAERMNVGTVLDLWQQPPWL